MRILLSRWFIPVLCLTAVAGLVTACSSSKPQADSNFDAKVSRPAFVHGGPRVLFDEAHRNIHTASGLYKPFAQLITNDGYKVIANTDSFTKTTLDGYQVLVIANALGSADANDNSAFTDEECDAVRQWVEAGGSLLLITDHAPTGAAAENLAQRLGVTMSKGMTEDPKNHDAASGDTTQLVFTRENGLLGAHPIIVGRDANERISKVMTFTGQALKAPVGGTSLLKLSGSAVNLAASIKVEKVGGDTNVHITYGDPTPATGYAQAIAFPLGRGRVVVLGEAAMLTAQVDGKTKKLFGMNVPGVDNRQFALNIVHWLSRLL